MVSKINAGAVKRADLFWVDPDEIEVDLSENGRHEPHSAEEIENLAESIAEQGQLQAVLVRRVEKNRLRLVAGFGRYRAVKHLNETKDGDQEKFKVQCKIRDCNPEEAFLLNLEENNQRKSTNSVDDAHNQRKLKEVYGWDDTKIAKFYRCSTAHVAQIRQLLSLPKDLQVKVATKEIPRTVATDLAQLSPKEQKEVLGEAEGQKKSALRAKVSQKLRRKKQQQGDSSRKSRTATELRSFFEDLTGPAEPEQLQRLATMMLEFISGEVSDEQMSMFLREAALEDE